MGAAVVRIRAAILAYVHVVTALQAGDFSVLAHPVRTSNATPRKLSRTRRTLSSRRRRQSPLAAGGRLGADRPWRGVQHSANGEQLRLRQRTELKDHHHGIIEDSYYLDRSGEGIHHKQQICSGSAILSSRCPAFAAPRATRSMRSHGSVRLQQPVLQVRGRLVKQCRAVGWLSDFLCARS